MDLLASVEPLLTRGMILAVVLLGVSVAWLFWPLPRETTAYATMTLPHSREAVWHAYFAGARLMTPGISFETATPGTLIDYIVTAGPDDGATCRITATVMVSEPYRRYAALVHTIDGKAFPGGPASMDGLLLEDASDGKGTIATVSLKVEAPSRWHMRRLEASVVLTLAKMQRRLAGPAEGAGTSPALAPA